MANNKDFKVKNGIQPTVYNEAVGTVVSGSEPYYLAGLTSSGKSASVSEDGTPIGSHISSDGTKLYMIGNATDTVYQYDMSTANDLSTATYNSVSLYVFNDGATSPKGITFKPDGTKMYVLDTTIVFEYSLSTAWDLSTASFTTGDSYDTTTQTGNCRGIQFTSDGLTMYVGDISPTDAIYQYTLSTAWQVNTASYASKSLNVITTGYGEFAFNADGTLLWVMSNTGVVTEYSLTTAYDVSTGTASGNTYDFSATTGLGIYTFHLFDSATKVAVGGSTDDTLHQFDIVLNTASLDLSTGAVFDYTPTSDVQVTVSNPAASGTVSSATLLLTGAEATGVGSTFSTTLYSGTATSEAHTVTNNIDLATDGGLLWVKKRDSNISNTSHQLYDTERGASAGFLSSDSTNAQSTGDLSSFNTDGFTWNASTGLGSDYLGSDYASWTFKKASNFFDVVTYTGNGTAGRTISHNLGTTVGCIIVKDISNAGENWWVYHRGIASDAETDAIYLNSTAAAFDDSGAWNDTAPTSTQFTVGGTLNSSFGGGANYVAYLFAHDTSADSIIKCGSVTYTTGATVDLGFEPQWVLMKPTDRTGNWIINDSVRGMPNGSRGPVLYADNSNSETANATVVYPTSTGFTMPSFLYDNPTDLVYIAIRSPYIPTITYDTDLEWSGGTAPTAPALGETDVITINTRDGGTTYQAIQAIDGAK